MERRAFSVSFTHNNYNNSFKLSKSESATHVCKFHDRNMVPALPLLVSLALPLWVLSRLVPQLVYRCYDRIYTEPGTRSEFIFCFG